LFGVVRASLGRLAFTLIVRSSIGSGSGLFPARRFLCVNDIDGISKESLHKAR